MSCEVRVQPPAGSFDGCWRGNLIGLNQLGVKDGELWHVKDDLTEGWFFGKTLKVETDGTSGLQIKGGSAGLAVS